MSSERYFRPFVAQKLMAKQEEQEAKTKLDRENSKISNLTIQQVFTEIGNTFKGISTDLFRNKSGATGLDIFTTENRLRGIGMACVVFSVSFLAVQAMNK